MTSAPGPASYLLADVETLRNLLRAEALHPDPADWGATWREAWYALARLAAAADELRQANFFRDRLAEKLTSAGTAVPHIHAALEALGEDGHTPTIDALDFAASSLANALEALDEALKVGVAE